MIDAVSRDETIPKSFLAKIFQDLAKAGLLRSQRGAGGGFILARSPDQITVLEVIEAIDGRIALQRCLGDEPECDRKEECALCFLFNQAQDRLKEVFARTSLADLAQKQASLGAARPPRVPTAANADRGANGDGNGASKEAAFSQCSEPTVAGRGFGPVARGRQWRADSAAAAPESAGDGPEPREEITRVSIQ